MNNKDVIWYLFMHIVLRKIQCFVCLCNISCNVRIEYIQFYVPKNTFFILIKIKLS